VNLIDKICPVCNTIYQVNRNHKYQKTVCSKSCSHSFYVRRKTVRVKTFICQTCGKEDKRLYGSSNKFCSVACKTTYNQQDVINRFYRGEIHDRHTLRRALKAERGYNCSQCSISDWNKKPITLQVNHIDGNCTNNMPENLELICPNCHSQTDTFGAKNKGNGRKARGLPLHY